MEFYKNRWIIYGICFFHNLIPAYVIERLFWQERGMTVQMVVYCEIIYALTIVLFEVPSGILADRIGRKKLVVISAVVPCLEFLILIQAHSFFIFGAVSFIAGISTAFSSGATNALLYDSLAQSNRTHEFEAVVGKANAFDFTAALIASISGGFLAVSFGFTFNYWVSAGSCVIALILSLCLAEPSKVFLDDEKRGSWLSIAKKAVSCFKDRVALLKIVINAAIVAAFVVYIDEFWQIYLSHVGVGVLFFGVVGSVLAFVRIPSSIVASTLLKRFSHQRIMVFSTLVCGLGIVWAAVSQSVFGIIGIGLSILVSGLIDPVVIGYLHQNADDEARATTESVASLIERSFGIIIGIVFGFISTRFNIITGFWLIGGGVTLLSFVFYSVYGRDGR